MGELERNMRDDVGQPQGNAPSTDNGGQMDMFEDERECASLHRRGAIARGVAKRGLVAFLAFAMAFGTTPAQLWAEGAEGIAEAVAQAATPSEGTGAADGAAAHQGVRLGRSVHVVDMADRDTRAHGGADPGAHRGTDACADGRAAAHPSRAVSARGMNGLVPRLPKTSPPRRKNLRGGFLFQEDFRESPYSSTIKAKETPP